MTFTSLVDLSASQKEEFVASLATLIVGSSSEGAISAESLVAVAEKSGNKLSASYATLFGKVTEAAGGIEKFTAVPGAGGGGGGVRRTFLIRCGSTRRCVIGGGGWGGDRMG